MVDVTKRRLAATAAKLGIRAGVACVIVGAILVVAFTRTPGPLRIGSRLPQFTLPEMNAGDFSLRNGRHHVLLVNFWATWCPPCVMEAPSLEKFAQQMRPLGVRLVGVSVDQSTPDLEKFAAGYRLTFPILRDPRQALASRFGTNKFPETYIFDRDGRLAEKIIGAADWEDPRMIAFVESLVRWPPVHVSGDQKPAGGNW